MACMQCTLCSLCSGEAHSSSAHGLLRRMLHDTCMALMSSAPSGPRATLHAPKQAGCRLDCTSKRGSETLHHHAGCTGGLAHAHSSLRHQMTWAQHPAIEDT